jgi:hypothetical protein
MCSCHTTPGHARVILKKYGEEIWHIPVDHVDPDAVRNKALERNRREADTEELGFLGTGRKYCVSDNAVRKWIRWYEQELGQGAAAPPSRAPRG